MGRPSTPGPADGEGSSEKGKAASALWMVLIGKQRIIMFSEVKVETKVKVEELGRYENEDSF